MNRDGLKEYIEKEIVPLYKTFDKGHNEEHVKHVIAESLELAKEYDTDPDMCYTIAAYHDTGIPEGREMHHINSAKILRKDQRLREWFSEKEIEIMAQAVEDHRASSKQSPRTIYGAIVAEADRDLRPEVIIKRCIQYGLNEYGDENNYQFHKERTLEHLKDKYGWNGYMKLHLNSRKNAEGLLKIREIIDSQEQFDKHFEKSWKTIKKIEAK